MQCINQLEIITDKDEEEDKEESISLAAVDDGNVLIS